MFAQTTAIGPEPILSLLQYGAIAFFAVAFIMGWVVPRPSLTQAVKQYEDTLAYRDATITRIIAERDVALKEIREQVSSLQSNINTVREETEEVLHMVESLAIRLQK